MKAYKTEIFLVEEQIVKVIKTIGVCRFLYNSYLAYNQELYEKEGKFCSGFDYDAYVNNELWLEKPWIKDVSSKARKKAIMNGDTAFRKFFKGENKYPKFKKKNKQNVRIYFPKNGKGDLLVQRHQVKVPTIGWVRLKEKGYIPPNAIVSSCTIEMKANRFYISVLVKEEPTFRTLTLDTRGIGIDLGLKTFAVTSRGLSFKNINKSQRIKKVEKQLKREQRALSRKYEHYKKVEKENKNKNKKQNTGGETATDQRKNLKKNILRVQKLHQRLTNMRNAYQAYVIQQVVKTKPHYITLEKLNVKGMMKNKHLSKAVSEQKFYEFKTNLVHACKKVGIEVREVHSFYPSSKLCSCCGVKKVTLSLSERIFRCDACGHTMDRDENAAMNLEQAKEYIILT